MSMILRYRSRTSRVAREPARRVDRLDLPATTGQRATQGVRVVYDEARIIRDANA